MNKLTDIIKRYGITGCLYKAILKIGRALGITYTQYRAYFKTLPQTMDADSLPPYCKMSLDDFNTQAVFNKEWFNAHKMNQIKEFIDKPGYYYYGIYDGGVLICYGAASMEYDNFMNRRSKPDAAYLFDGYTNPHYRGKGLHKSIVDIREYEAWKQNKSVTFAYVHSLNPASAKGFDRCGYKAKARLIYTQIGTNKPFKKRVINL